MPTLYELTAEYQSAMDALEADPEITLDVARDTLEGLAGEFEDKVKNVAFYIQNLKATAQAIEDAESKMRARREAMEHRAAWLEGYTMDCLKRAKIAAVECEYFKVSIRKNPPKVDILSELTIPREFVHKKVVESIDKAEIGRRLKDGESVTGAKLTQSERLVIR